MPESINSMLDASLFVDDSYESTFEMTHQHQEEFDFYISTNFYNLVMNDRLIDDEHVREYFSPYSSFYKVEEMKQNLRHSNIAPYDGGEFREDYRERYESIAQSVFGREQY